VHAIKSRVTGLTPWVVPAARRLALAALLLCAVAWIWSPGWRAVALAASLPLAGVAVVNKFALSPKKLKRVGWTVVGANLLALLVLVAAEKMPLTL
jgi:hypothetical protein